MAKRLPKAGPMPSLATSAGLVLLGVGILVVAFAFGLVVFSQDDAAAQEAGPAGAGGQPGGDDRAGRLGQTLALGGAGVAFLGLVLLAVGRGGPGDRPAS